MMRKILLIIFTFFLGFSQIDAHPWKPDHYVVIDTDCGLDDFRAINLMLASSNIRVLAIISSNGVINAEDGYLKLRNLLNDQFHEGIRVGINMNTEQREDCIPAINFCWGKETDKLSVKPIPYTDVLDDVFKNFSEKITFINLGSLNTIKTYLNTNPSRKQQIKEIIWTTDKEIKKSFNYLIDTASYNSLNTSGISMVYGSTFGSYNDQLINKLKTEDVPLNHNLYRSMQDSENPFAKKIYDEAAVFYLLDKNIFSLDTSGGYFKYSLKNQKNITEVFEDLLLENYKTQSQAFLDFTEDPSDYYEDIQPIIQSTIKQYGKEEWSASIITSELHRHIGVYSLIGAKMGIRAREYFGAGIDEMKVVSYAGLTPPFSCLNDGLQVSTGATLGHGLISVHENQKLPKADFYYLGKKITITLKEEYKNKIASEIKELRVIYGLDSNVYWDLVRKLAIKYWADWDRHEIFEIQTE